MKFEEARGQILSALDVASGALNERLVATRLREGVDINFSELEFDSLAAMEFCIEIEEKTGIEIDLADLARHSSVNALANFLAERLTSG